MNAKMSISGDHMNRGEPHEREYVHLLKYAEPHVRENI